MEENIIDRISELPECIVHRILSFLNSPADLVRTSVLSKKWFAQTSSFPILDFDFDKFCKAYKYNWKIFFKYAVYTMSRFCKQNVSAHTFKVKTWFGARIEEVEIINKWIGVIFKKGVQVFVIEVPYCVHPSMYRLPNTLLLSASSLTSLTISYCYLPSSLMVDPVKFKCLKLLHLNNVPLSDELIKYLTSCCPLLEEFNVGDCRGFKRFSVLGHQNLRKVRMSYHSEVERIDIEAPNLSTFSLRCHKMLIDSRCMNLTSCKKLTRLHYDAVTLAGLHDLSSNFPFLEHLTLELPYECGKLKFSSHSLKTFVLNSTCDLKKINMNTPNLVLFVYGLCSRVASIPLKLRMECDLHDFVDSHWFQQLRRFLEKSNGFKELKLCVPVDYADDFEELKMIQSQPVELEHLDLHPMFAENLAEHESVVDAGLWCCRPRSLTLQSYFSNIDFEEWSHLVKFTYEKLLKQEEDEGHTNIRIILSSKSKMHFSDLNSLLKSLLPCDLREEKITFIKEQVV